MNWKYPLIKRMVIYIVAIALFLWNAFAVWLKLAFSGMGGSEPPYDIWFYRIFWAVMLLSLFLLGKLFFTLLKKKFDQDLTELQGEMKTLLFVIIILLLPTIFASYQGYVFTQRQNAQFDFLTKKYTQLLEQCFITERTIDLTDSVSRGGISYGSFDYVYKCDDGQTIDYTKDGYGPLEEKQLFYDNSLTMKEQEKKRRELHDKTIQRMSWDQEHCKKQKENTEMNEYACDDGSILIINKLRLTKRDDSEPWMRECRELSTDPLFQGIYALDCSKK